MGSLTPGHYADMIAVADDPLKDVSVLSRLVLHVMKGGVLVR